MSTTSNRDVAQGARRRDRDLQASSACKVVQVDLPDQMMVAAAALIVLAVEAATYHAPWLRTRAGRLRRAGAQPAAERARLQRGRVSRGAALARAMRSRRISRRSASATPCSRRCRARSRRPSPRPTSAAAGNAEAIIQGITRFMRPINYLGLPALVVPAGFGQRDMPIGLQLIGRPFNDETCRGARHRVPGRDRPSHAGCRSSP